MSHLKTRDVSDNNKDKPKNLLIYDYKDFPDSYENLCTSLNAGLLQDTRLESLCAYKSLAHFKDKNLLQRFNHRVKTDAISDLYSLYLIAKSIDISRFNAIIFLNSSCIGPILPAYFSAEKWSTIFSNKIANGDQLVAPIIEFPSKGVVEQKLIDHYQLSNLHKLESIPFLHTYCFCIAPESLQLLVDSGALPRSEPKREDAVCLHERAVTAILLSRGKSVSCLLKAFGNDKINLQSSNAIFKHATRIAKAPVMSDPEIQGHGYFGTDLTPYEVVFFKNIRHPGTQRGLASSFISRRNRKFLTNIVGLKSPPEDTLAKQIGQKFKIEISHLLNSTLTMRLRAFFLHPLTYSKTKINKLLNERLHRKKT